MKKILITQRLEKNQHGDFIDSLEHNYIEYFEKLGYKLVIVPNRTKNLKSYLENIYGIILTGGGSTPLKKLSIRDKIEIDLIKNSIKNKIPLLGICRGMQMINYYFGGKLKKIKKHVKINHEIYFKKKKIAKVNSYHNEAILKKNIHKDLEIIAETKDNVIEAIKHKKHKILGIMWHPERMNHNNKFNKKLIKEFLK